MCPRVIKTLTHLHYNGQVFGFSALVCLFPDDEMGIAVMDNMDGIENRETLISMYTFDILLGACSVSVYVASCF